MDIKTIYRVVLMVLIWFTQIRQTIISCLPVEANCWNRNTTLTIQTNYAIGVWLLLWLWWRSEPEKTNNLDGFLKGALTSYITLVMLAYHFLLSATDDTFWSFSNWSQHYIVPMLFIIDWALFERERYDWSFIPKWLIYPLAYAGFAMVNGILGLPNGFIYGFLDPIRNSWNNTFMMIGIITIFFIVIASFYVAINRKVLTNPNVKDVQID